MTKGTESKSKVDRSGAKSGVGGGIVSPLAIGPYNPGPNRTLVNANETTCKSLIVPSDLTIIWQ